MTNLVFIVSATVTLLNVTNVLEFSSHPSGAEKVCHDVVIAQRVVTLDVPGAQGVEHLCFTNVVSRTTNAPYQMTREWRVVPPKLKRDPLSVRDFPAAPPMPVRKQ